MSENLDLVKNVDLIQKRKKKKEKILTLFLEIMYIEMEL